SATEGFRPGAGPGRRAGTQPHAIPHGRRRTGRPRPRRSQSLPSAIALRTGLPQSRERRTTSANPGNRLVAAWSREAGGADRRPDEGGAGPAAERQRGRHWADTLHRSPARSGTWRHAAAGRHHRRDRHRRRPAGGGGMIPVSYYLAVGAGLFALGLIGF